MVGNITLTSPIRSNLLSLTNIAKQMDKTQLILATGKKVNTALDNASAYYQARSLTNRSADLNALLDAMDQGIQTIEAASQGIETATSLLEQMQSITTLRSLAESLGNQYSIIQTRADFTSQLTDILETGADDLTLADMNEASDQYLSLQTRQQLALNSLSLAAQSAQSVLNLFN